MFTTWHGNYQKHHRIILWFSLSANMFLWIEEKGNFDLKTWIGELNQNKNRATTFWKASLDSKWPLMRVTAGSLKVNTSLAKFVPRQHFFLIGRFLKTRLENWTQNQTQQEWCLPSSFEGWLSLNDRADFLLARLKASASYNLPHPPFPLSSLPPPHCPFLPAQDLTLCPI